MDYKKTCLTCLGNDREMRNLNSIVCIAGDDVRLSDILVNFYDFKVFDEQFPDIICINCVHQLTLTYSFKSMIENSSKTLTENIYNTDSCNDINEFTCQSDEEIEPNKVKNVYRRVTRKKRLKEDYLKPLFCVECKDQFYSVQALHEHYASNHHIKSTIGRDCEFCREKFDSFSSLVLHRKFHLSPYVCDTCWEGFYCIESLNNHVCLKKELKKDEKSGRILKQCDQCGKSYPSTYIRVHMLTHGEKRPYHCKYCPKKFKVPGGLNSHVLWNHKRTRNYKCDVCNATFISASSRGTHVRKHHLKEKKYSCKCGKKFFAKSELERHMLTHTGVKNFHCHLCEKSYQTRYGLNVHLKSHTQVNPNILNL